MTDDERAAIEQLLDQLAEAQRKKVLDLARRLDPRITEDDVLNPHDVPALASSPEWNYEDGVLGGFLSARMALRRLLRG